MDSRKALSALLAGFTLATVIGILLTSHKGSSGERKSSKKPETIQTLQKK